MLLPESEDKLLGELKVMVFAYLEHRGEDPHGRRTDRLIVTNGRISWGISVKRDGVWVRMEPSRDVLCYTNSGKIRRGWKYNTWSCSQLLKQLKIEMPLQAMAQIGGVE